MEKSYKIVHYGARFSRELRDIIQEFRKVEDELLDEAQSLSVDWVWFINLYDSQSESNPKSKIDELFAVRRCKIEGLFI
jgi:hypothetical protein